MSDNHKALAPAGRIDPPAGLAGAIVVLLGISGLMESHGLTADEVAMALGALMTLAAWLRSWGPAVAAWIGEIRRAG